MKLEFRHLELLVAVEDTGDLAAAARRLDLSAQNAARQLDRIEEHLGHAVFERLPHRTVPTAAGLDDLAVAREALRAVADIAAVRPRRSALRLLHYRSPLPGVVQGLQAAHPGISTTLEVTLPEQAHRLVADGRADAFVGCVLPHVVWPSHPGLVANHILSDPTVVVLPRTHRLAGDPLVDLSALAGDDWITLPDPDTRYSVVQECRLVGGFEPTLAYEVMDDAAVRALLVDGLGVVLGSSVLPPDDGYVLRPYTGATPSRFVTVHDPRRTDAAVVRTIAELVRARFAGYGAGAGPRPPVHRRGAGGEDGRP